MLISILTTFVLLQTPAAPAQEPASADQQEQLDIGDTVRAAVRWMRSTQDPVDGSYGGSVETTACVVRALAECPDRYRAFDGPFVRRAVEWLVAKQRDDGSICDGGASADAVQQQTLAAAEALFALGDALWTTQLGKSLAFLGATDLEPRGFGPRAELTVEQLLAHASQVAAAQVAPGQWGANGKPDLRATARAVLDLSATERLIKQKSAPPPSATTTIEKLPTFTSADRAAALRAIEQGADFLAAISQDGKWGAPGKPDAGLTAMALTAMQTRPAPRPEAQQELIDAGLAWLAALQKPDGSIHDGKLANYTTSAAILAFTRAHDAKWQPAVENARAFLQALQADEGEGYSEGDLYYGGIGYGSTERPDLSNLQMALEALSASGLEPNAPTYKKALKFLERCQNRSESNDLRLADGDVVIESGNDGGAGYAPGDSKAGFVDLGNGRKVPRSYGSMTYALLKCMLFAGLPKDDPRLAAAVEWCRKHYTLDVNPGFDTSGDPSAPYQGLFYYLHTLAQALDAMEVETIEDASGVAHAWRQEVCGRMVSMQSKIDGSWTNHNSPRWYEGNPLLGTAYALLTLDAALPPAK